MQTSYQKPIINKIDFQAASKYGSPLKTQKIRQTIDSIPVGDLVKEFGSPLFVFSKESIIQRYNRLFEAFSTRYSDFQLSWSYKTNYLNAICKIYHELGSLAEVVSEFEYQKARALGVLGKDIIFNGPYKPTQALEVAVKEGAKIHIDNLFELGDLEKIAQKLGTEIPVAIRVNMDIGVYPQWSRFGFNFENREAHEAIDRIEQNRFLRLEGLHTHIGTFMLDAQAYAKATLALMRLKEYAETTYGSTISYIDLGGGFASKSRLKGIYQSPDVVVPSVDDYAEAITETIYRYNKSERLPKLYLETGRHLIDEAGFLLTSVWGWKRFPDGRKGYILDAGVNLLYTSTWYDFTVELDRRYEGDNEPSLLNGPLCMNIDVIEENIQLPPLDRGSILTLSPVGAYNYTQSMQFIRYRPAVVLIENSQARLIREADDLEAVNFKER